VADNATNNDVACRALIRVFHKEEKESSRRSRCLSHIINLAAQAFIYGRDNEAFIAKVDETEAAAFGVQTVVSIVRGRELIVLGEGVNLFYIPLPPSLVDKTLAEAAIATRTGLNVIALQQDNAVRTDLGQDLRLPRDCELVVLGSTEQRERFRAAYR
jgi:hypothetical protein